MFKLNIDTVVSWLLRARFLQRWPLMKTDGTDSVSTHCYETAVIAFKIGVIAKVIFDKPVSPERIATLALTHEASEAAGVSDVPSPVKYANPAITDAIKALEAQVEESLVETISDDAVKEYMRPYIQQSYADPYEKRLVKAADDIAAYIYATQRLNEGSREFAKASRKLLLKVNQHANDFREVAYFYEKVLPHCLKSLDELID
ncbi:5'-deoxynucleotidase [Vibrio tubiashii]|uniref:5'-deoxynucleotidase n=1 Tax=Vibrio tubiashii TaxID=29498 RepID=UPI001EFC55D8|nr:5'-deoxynucleotidase [Vibrio tubiashii]MCG9576042.1 5'-deoxynucleotidase [Vibrio tubiashii]